MCCLILLWNNSFERICTHHQSAVFRIIDTVRNRLSADTQISNYVLCPCPIERTNTRIWRFREWPNLPIVCLLVFVVDPVFTEECLHAGNIHIHPRAPAYGSTANEP